jgi:hypothetical protein
VNQLQPSLHGDDEVQAPEPHERARGPSSGVVGHPQPGGIDRTRKRPLPGAPTVGVSDCRLVNLCLHVWLGWYPRKTQGFILIQAECPYVQFELLVFLHWFAVGVTNGQDRERVPRSLIAKCYASVSVSKSSVPLGESSHSFL